MPKLFAFKSLAMSFFFNAFVTKRLDFKTYIYISVGWCVRIVSLYNNYLELRMIAFYLKQSDHSCSNINFLFILFILIPYWVLAMNACLSCFVKEQLKIAIELPWPGSRAWWTLTGMYLCQSQLMHQLIDGWPEMVSGPVVPGHSESAIVLCFFFTT